MTEFFDDWGSQQNPVRQSDLNSLFGGWGCQKRWAMAKLYPDDERGKAVPYKRFMGSLVHQAIHRMLVFDKPTDLHQETFNEGVIINWDKDQTKEFEPYPLMIEALFTSPEFKSLKSRIVDSERSFMMKLGDLWIAGTLDLIVRGKAKNSLVVIDWKTGPPVSQYELDNGYQSNLYALAVKEAEFFMKPEDMSDGRAYYKSWKATKQKNTYGTWPQMRFAHIKELVPAQRASKRQSKHISSKSLADPEGVIQIAKGDRRGPVFYEARPSEENVARLEYALKCATIKAQTGLFDESIGPLCERCHFQEKCRKLGMAVGRKQQVLELMNDLGVEPT